MPIATADQIFHFGGLVLDTGRGTLTRGDESCFLRPKSYALLTHLARNLGRVVPKSELMDAVWPGIYVTEDSLTQAVREIRKLLGEDQVRTVSKRGYMLAEINPAPDPGKQPVVAVLRFRNESLNASDGAIVDGMAEDIINGLARFGAITVLSRNTSFSFASDARNDWSTIHSRIGANYIVEGSVRRLTNGIAASVNLVDASNGAQLWGERYSAEGTGLFGLQRNIIEAIVGRLATRVDHASLQRALYKPAATLDAYELLVRGTALLRDPAQSDLSGAETLFQAAIDKDPACGLAYIHLALSRVLVGEYGRPDPAILENARELAAKGLSIAPEQTTGHRVLGLVRLYMRDHDAAEHHLRMACDLNPCDFDSIENMGFLMTMRGRPLDALSWLDQAGKINPLDPHWPQYDRSLALYLLADYRGSVQALERASRPTPWIRTRLAAGYAQLGNQQEAARQISLAKSAKLAFSPLDYASDGLPFEHKSDADHFAEGIRLAIG